MKLSNEHKILIYCLEELEDSGRSNNGYIFNFEKDDLYKVNDKFSVNYSFTELEVIIKKGLANDLFTYVYISARLDAIKITDIGLGIAKSKKRELQDYSEKSFLRKFSDKIQEHSGFVSLMAIVISLFSLIQSFWK